MRNSFAAWLVPVLTALLPAQGPFELPPMHHAAAAGDVECLGQLLADGAEIDMRRNAITCSGRDGGDTALHCAAAAGQVACVQWLLRRGAQLAVEDNQHRTPLDAAAAAGQIEVIDLLLAAGARVTTTTFVATARDPDTARHLVRRGGDPRCGDRDGRTPLHEAEVLACADTVAELAFDRAIWFAPDQDGRTPLELAVEWRLHETVELAVAASVLEDKKLPADSPLREQVASLLADAPKKAGIDDMQLGTVRPSAAARVQAPGIRLRPR